jgi:ABC-2 type transport system permease protein
MAFLRKPIAFLYKDFLSQVSYKFAFISQLLGIFLSALAWFFLSKLFGKAVSPHLKSYGGDYFSFVLIGIAFSSYLQVALNSFSTNIRNAQTLGTLEAMLVTQTGLPTLIFSSSLYSFLFTSLRVVVYLLIGAFIFSVQIGGANYVAALLILLLTVICFSSMGIISASFIMVIKKGNPLNWIFINLSWLIGGVYYPITVLPVWLKKISYLLPITYALEGMRMALLKGSNLISLLPTVIPLVIFSVLMLPVSLGVFSFAVKRAKIEGSLIQY